MLQFAEQMLKGIRKLRESTQDLVLSGSVPDMERYRFLMGRLEGIKLMESMVKDFLDEGDK